ncbi:ead/Ea22-like family protein [Citrobacter sp. Ce104]|uniref:ead/Ea22-like family protein n=1 Tax=Citrobacter sp. Ce104 TaxID=2985040 RepID=UPI00257670A6|nr:ead/Ea22-like family protein [Citrobacter sp. Ce104]MDM3280747.1 ead/Ea22-like family protein [Citrobacter sp. Ce104]
MTALNKQALREAAEKATPGRWEYYPGNTSIEYNVDSLVEDQGSIVYVDSGDFTRDQTDRNGEFIAAANPATVLALLDELEESGRLRLKFQEVNCELCQKLEAAEKRIAEHNFENRLLANADRDIKALRQRIAELEAREVTLPYLPDDCDRTEAHFKYQAAIAAAGIGVKGE